MSYTSRPFEELDVLDDFLMNAVASDPEVGEAFCRKLLSVLLDRRIGNIRVTVQRTLPAPTPTHRGIRMDVEIEEYNGDAQTQVINVYDLEPHLQKNQNLPKHNRFYQAKTDVRYLKEGEKNFGQMPDLFIINILNFDPFGRDYMMYTIQNHCVEIDDLPYEDGLKFIYFYTEGTKGGSEQIKAVLRYLQHSIAENAADASTQELHDYISRIKVMPEVRQSYMEFEEYIFYKELEAARQTRIQNILTLLEDYGDVPEQLKEKLEDTMEEEQLKKYLKLAAKAASMEDFIEKIGGLST